MQTMQKTNSRTERLAATALLIVAAATSAQNLLHWAKVAEKRKLNVAASDYSAVRKMYAGKSNANAAGPAHLVATVDSPSDAMLAH